MGENVERLFSGLFECGECGICYRVADAGEAALFCLECGVDLEPFEDEENKEDLETESDHIAEDKGESKSLHFLSQILSQDGWRCRIGKQLSQ